MNANDRFFARDAQVDAAAVAPLPASRKIYVEGSRPDIRVPMREIAQGDTPASFGAEKNPSLAVYDTSGPYTDPAADIDIRKGLAPLRSAWIAERDDTEELAGPSSDFRPGAPRRSRARGTALRPAPPAAAREARGAQRHADALRAARHHHAGDGIRRHPREPAARRARAAEFPGRACSRQHPGQSFGAAIPADDHARVRARRGRPRPRHHPHQHQPPGNRADDHRPQLPGEDQRQHRQLRGDLVDRRGSREDDLGDPLGRRHGHGPVHRQEHPRDARVDRAQLAGADRHGADLPGAGEGRRQGRGAHLGDLPRHADRAGRAGRRLLHHPRRRAAALHPDDGQAHDRHRLARRLDHGQVVPRASPGRASSTRTSRTSARS